MTLDCGWHLFLIDWGHSIIIFFVVTTGVRLFMGLLVRPSNVVLNPQEDVIVVPVTFKLIYFDTFSAWSRIKKCRETLNMIPICHFPYHGSVDDHKKHLVGFLVRTHHVIYRLLIHKMVINLIPLTLKLLTKMAVLHIEIEHNV